MPLSLSVVTAERTVLQRDDVQRLTVPTTEGQITILPSHVPLMTALGFGEMVAVTPQGPIAMAIFGGFLQVARNVVTVLADAAERADEIDEARAEAARERAQRRISGVAPDRAEAIDMLRAHLALQRSLLRLRVRRRHSGAGVPSMRT